MPDSKRLIVNADDFGLSEKTNEGIVHAHLHGVITSTTLMMNMPATSHALDLIRRYPSLDTGVHINLTWGRPVCNPGRIKTLVRQDGQFMGKGSLIIRLLMGKVRASHLEDEIRAQIERFVATGLALYHMDMHQHLHAVPKVMRVVMKVARQHHVPYVRCPRERLSVNPTVLSVKLALLMAKREWHSEVKTSDEFTGIALEGSLTEVKLYGLISHLPSGTTELMCHPGYYDSSISGISRLVAEREHELRILTLPKVREWLQENDVVLTNYRSLVLESARGCAPDGGGYGL